MSKRRIHFNPIDHVAIEAARQTKGALEQAIGHPLDDEPHLLEDRCSPIVRRWSVRSRDIDEPPEAIETAAVLRRHLGSLWGRPYRTTSCRPN